MKSFMCVEQWWWSSINGCWLDKREVFHVEEKIYYIDEYPVQSPPYLPSMFVIPMDVANRLHKEVPWRRMKIKATMGHTMLR